MITFRQLSYLEALARHQHFGRAAQECGVSQPALSMQLRELEEILGIELIERRPGAPMLTELGIEIAQRGGVILGAVRDLTDLAQHRANVLSGTLRLGVIPTLAPYILPNLLPKLDQEYPGLCLELLEAQTKVLLAELERGALDVLLLALPLKVASVETVHLFTDRFLLIVPADDPLSETVRVTSHDVEERKLILLEEGHCLRDQALEYCGKMRRAVASDLRATSLATVLQMVASGYGVTLLPEVAIDVELRDDRMKLLRFARPEPNRSIGLAWRRTSPRKVDFVTFGRMVTNSLNAPARLPQAHRCPKGEAVAHNHRTHLLAESRRLAKASRRDNKMR